MRIWGDYWEAVALDYLTSKKLGIIKKNYFCKAGEIDLIMKDQDTLVFIEVKYRKNSDWVSALESVTKSKQRKIIRAAQMFLLQNKQFKDWNCRFDVVSIEGTEQNPAIEWIDGAFY